MIEKAATGIGILLFLYGIFTYGGWYFATNYEWQAQGKHELVGCLRLTMGLNTVNATISSHPNANPKGTTIVDDGFPIFWKFTGKQKFSGSLQVGYAEFSFTGNTITMRQYYRGNGPDKTEEVTFLRTKYCVK